jgi:hypothetical protein
MTPDLSLSQVKNTPRHLDRKAVISMRQSSPKPVREHLDSPLTQGFFENSLLDRGRRGSRECRELSESEVELEIV